MIQPMRLLEVGTSYRAEAPDEGSSQATLYLQELRSFIAIEYDYSESSWSFRRIVGEKGARERGWVANQEN